MEHSKEVSYALKKLKQITGMTMEVRIENPEEEKKVLTQIKRLCKAYQEKYSQTHFLQNIIQNVIPMTDILEDAAYFRIDVQKSRVLFLLQARDAHNEEMLEILKNMFPARTGVLIVPLTDKEIAILYPIEIDDKVLQSASAELKEEILLLSHTIIDTLSAEAMSSIQIAYSTVFDSLSSCQAAYKNAALALKIGNLFYSERNIFSYDNLGIGKLICQIPVAYCEEFVMEIFGTKFSEIDSELEQTARTFIKHNLNIAETARQLHMHRNTLIYRLDQIEKQTGLNIRGFEEAMTFELACMVGNYLKSL